MKIRYTNETEKLFKEEAERSEGMSILHDKSFKKYTWFSVLINIPVIVLSSVVGFITTIEMFESQNYMIGALSIFIAIIKTLDSYFSWTSRAENHRIMSLAYVKIAKFIQIQLALERVNRIEASDMLKIIQNDLQNLRESESPIDEDIIVWFNTNHTEIGIKKPAICNGLTEIRVNILETEEKEEEEEEKQPEELPALSDAATREEKAPEKKVDGKPIWK